MFTIKAKNTAESNRYLTNQNPVKIYSRCLDKELKELSENRIDLGELVVRVNNVSNKEVCINEIVSRIYDDITVNTAGGIILHQKISRLNFIKESIKTLLLGETLETGGGIVSEIDHVFCQKRFFLCLKDMEYFHNTFMEFYPSGLTADYEIDGIGYTNADIYEARIIMLSTVGDDFCPVAEYELAQTSPDTFWCPVNTGATMCRRTCENRQNISVRYNGQNLRYDTEQMCIINKASNCIPRSEDVERWMFMLECAVRKRENNHYLKGDA